MKRYILAALFCILFPFAAVMTAQSAEKDSINIIFMHDNQPVQGAKFQVYKAAELDEDGYEMMEKFSKYGILESGSLGTGDEKNLANTLEAYALRDKVGVTASGVTDASGKLCFNNLSSGMYLVTGSEARQGDVLLFPQPSLIAVPHMREDGTSEHRVIVEPKYDYRKQDIATVTRRALKIWDDNGDESARPEQITVQLLRDGEVYDEQVLNKVNNWRYEWTGLEASRDWKVAEKEVPNGFAVRIGQQDITFTITNTKVNPDGTAYDEQDKEPEDEENGVSGSVSEEKSGKPGDPGKALSAGSSEEKLPQTGMTWWPVPVLAIAGMIFVFCGIFLLYRKRDGKDA